MSVHGGRDSVTSKQKKLAARRQKKTNDVFVKVFQKVYLRVRDGHGSARQRYFQVPEARR